jgi:hypothetical protein
MVGSLRPKRPTPRAIVAKPQDGQASGIAIIGTVSKSGGEMRKSASDHPTLSRRAITSANTVGSR